MRQRKHRKLQLLHNHIGCYHIVRVRCRRDNRYRLQYSGNLARQLICSAQMTGQQTNSKMPLLVHDDNGGVFRLMHDIRSNHAHGNSRRRKKNYRIAIIGFFGYIDKQNEDESGQSYVYNIELKNIGGIRGKSGQKLPAYMNEVEIQKFLKCIDEFEQSEKISARNRLAIKLIIYTGVRVSEALNLRLKDVFPEGEAYLLQIRGKGDKMRIAMVKRMHIQTLLEEWLSKRKELGIKSELLICNQKGVALTQAYIYKVVDQILSYGGIFKEKMGAHMLRHSFATLLYQKSQDLVLVQEALGHADLNTSRIYTHFDKNRLMEAASIMDEM